MGETIARRDRSHEAGATETPSTVVVALGGNAILQPGQLGTFEEQLVNVDAATRRIAGLIASGWRVVLTHGNGPQVGNLLIQQETAARLVAPLPMDVCGAMSQGEIGYLIEQTLANHLAARRIDVPVVTILTQVVVSERDPAFAAPSKPVGPFYSAERARELALEGGYAMREDAGRGWRRVVPSPAPVEIVPRAAIAHLAATGACVVCSGGGGIPVVRRRGRLSGVAAVIDKDAAATRLALDLGAEALLILTDVPNVSIGYRTPDERVLADVTAAELRAHAAAGEFAAGSMGPKVEAILAFLEGGGQRAVVASLTDVEEALAGRAGTQVRPGPRPARSGARPARDRDARRNR
jgi:carbamate kinase